MTMSRSVWIAVVSSLVLAGCGEREFGEGKVRYQIETQKTQLDGEQVMLTRGQVDCGVQAELWEMEHLGRDQEFAKLNQSARDLGFGDDVQFSEVGASNPYVQIRGSFLLSLIQVNNIRTEGPQNKVVDAKIGVRINHPCFENPLPTLMGVKRGKFTATTDAALRFRLDNDWVYDQIVH
jgi:hypothetical protein